MGVPVLPINESIKSILKNGLNPIGANFFLENPQSRIEDLMRKVILGTEITQVVKIFLSTSYDLRKEERDFLKLINRENKVLEEHGIFLQVKSANDHLTSSTSIEISNLNIQLSIRECDVFISLYGEKTRHYIINEHQYAFQQFKLTGKPYILLYCKADDPKNADLERSMTNQLFLEENGWNHLHIKYTDSSKIFKHFLLQLESWHNRPKSN